MRWNEGVGAQPLVGRDAELARLRAQLDSASADNSLLVGLIGDAGIGKTALLHAFANEAEARGWLCVRASGSRLSRDVPYAALSALADDYLGSQPDAIGADDDPLTIWRELRAAAMDYAAEAAGLVILLDDVHWMDEPSLRAFEYLSQRAMEVPLVMVFASRPSPMWTDRLMMPESPDQLALIELSGLSREAAAELVADSGGEIDSIVDLAAGNPFYLKELSTRGMGPVLTAVLMRDFEQSSEVAQRLAIAAVILGERFDLRRAAELAGIDDPAGVIDELVANRMVEQASAPTEFAFRHALLSMAIYRSIPSGRRIQLHADAAKLLAAAGASPVQVARHLAESASVGDVAAVEAIVTAGLHVRGAAPVTAAALFATAARLLPETGPAADQRPVLYSMQAESVMRSGDYETAHQLIEEGLRIADSSDVGAQIWLYTTLYRIGRNRPQLSDVYNRLLPLDELLPADDLEHRAALETVLQVEAGIRGDIEVARSRGQHAREIFAASDTLEFEYLETAILAYNEATAGDVQRADELAAEARMQRLRLSDKQLGVVADGLIMESSAQLWLARFADALEAAQVASASGREFGNSDWDALALQLSGTALVYQGRLELGIEELSDAAQAARLTGNEITLCIAAHNRALAFALSGEWHRAWRYLAQAKQFADVSGDRWRRSFVAHTTAELMLMSGQASQVPGTLLPLLDSTPYITVCLYSTLCEQLTIAYRAIGDNKACGEWAQRAAEFAGQPGHQRDRGHVMRAAAHAQLAAGQPGNAIESAVEAMRSERAAGATIGRLHAQLIAAEGLVAAGNRGDAIESLMRTREFALANEIHYFESVSSHRLRELGESVPAAALGAEADSHSLTVREYEVASLVADGLSNQEIAKALFLSRRTVEAHMSRIFRKLGVRSRVQLVGRLREIEDPRSAH